MVMISHHHPLPLRGMGKSIPIAQGGTKVINPAKGKNLAAQPEKPRQQHDQTKGQNRQIPKLKMPDHQTAPITGASACP
tara:strand:- start:141548 stop:141784 length:237 start_codon:yes stop_codon:yes gene_type:complete